MEWDNEIIGELNRRTHRYKLLDIFNVNPKHLQELKEQDINWIERVCESEGYVTKPYLDYYNERTT